MNNLVKLLTTLVPYVAYIGALIAIINLIINLRDRRPRLEFRQKAGEWCKKQDKILFAYYEVYNPSSRPNAIRDYILWSIQEAGGETHLNTEECTIGGEKGNVRPLGIPPYSGCQFIVGGHSETSLSATTRFRIRIIDLFEKTYEFELDLTKDGS